MFEVIHISGGNGGNVPFVEYRYDETRYYVEYFGDFTHTTIYLSEDLPPERILRFVEQLLVATFGRVNRKT